MVSEGSPGVAALETRPLRLIPLQSRNKERILIEDGRAAGKNDI